MIKIFRDQTNNANQIFLFYKLYLKRYIESIGVGDGGHPPPHPPLPRLK